jgi:glycerol-3-phosphate dehydrogenase
MTKKCYRCKEVKELTFFCKNSAQKSGYSGECKKCKSALTKIWCKNNPDKVKAYEKKSKARYKEHNRQREKNGHYVRNYGITENEVLTMLKEQGNRCSICLVEFDNTTRRVEYNVDHNHSTDAVRELLCIHCNHALGSLKESPVTAVNAAIYLQKHSTLHDEINIPFFVN